MFNQENSKHILLYVVIGIAIYFFFFHKKEGFFPFSRNTQCKLVTDTHAEIKNVVDTKCKTFDEPSSRGNINQRAECYTFAGQEIVSDLDKNSWCDLDENDMAIIDAAAKTMEESESALHGYDSSKFDSRADF
jgi:hypothetical protein